MFLHGSSIEYDFDLANARGNQFCANVEEEYFYCGMRLWNKLDIIGNNR
jgi:hypothetical protein